MRSGNGAVGALVLLASACVDNSGASDARREPIAWGEPYAGDPSTVMLVVGGEIACTGAVLDARAVLTARSCLEDAGQRIAAAAIEIRSGAGLDDGARVAGVLDYVTTQGVLAGQDLAVLLLDRPVALVPYAWTGEAAVGAPIVAIGYGRGFGEARKRRGTSAIASVRATEIAATSAIACEADAGGPAFDASGRILGVAAGSAECTATYTRTDAFRDLIEGAIARAMQLGTTPAPPMPATPIATPEAMTPGDADGDACPDAVDEAPDDYDDWPYDRWGDPCLEDDDWDDGWDDWDDWDW